MEQVSRPIALVTGASRGIGKAISLMLARKGYCVAINATNGELLKTLKKEIEAEGGNAAIFQRDLLQGNESPQGLIEDIKAAYGRLDLLVNNAGIAQAKPFDQISFNDFDLVMGLNVKVPLFLSQAALPILMQSDNPIIINISSVVGTRPYSNQSLYAASKHALNGLMKALAKEMHDKGIRVHIISPGGVGTEMVMKTRPDLDMEDMIKPGEVAEAVEFLLDFKGRGIIDEISIRRRNNEPFK